MFRLDDHFVVDATEKGGLARFVNHSCDPNCYTQIITHDGRKKIMLYAKRPIYAGEELCYDYKFPIENDPKDKVGAVLRTQVSSRDFCPSPRAVVGSSFRRRARGGGKRRVVAQEEESRGRRRSRRVDEPRSVVGVPIAPAPPHPARRLAGAHARRSFF